VPPPWCPVERAYGLVDDAALVVDGEATGLGRPTLGATHNLLDRCTLHHDAGGALVTPGLIDCHTHLVYGGDRAAEFEMRLNGASYEDIARAGGGITSTVKATREASAQELQASSAKRLQQLIGEGVTTIEIKSGYGLALEQERKCLQVARTLGHTHAVDVRTTFLGAHAVPPEFAGRPMRMSTPCCRCSPSCTPRAWWMRSTVFVNVLLSTRHRSSAYSRRHKRWACRSNCMPSNSVTAAERNWRRGSEPLSCDHLEWLSPEGARAMAAAGTVAVLLPGAFYFLRETKLPPVDLLRANIVCPWPFPLTATPEVLPAPRCC
jgi:imidazolonepropionase